MNDRREILGVGAAIGAAVLLGGAAEAQIALPSKTPAPGRAGDFDFLTGEWTISHRRLLADKSWDTFEGEATCWSILKGVVSIEELRIPARDFSGMGIRLLDAGKNGWEEFWANAKGGSMAGPGMPGSFENGAATFMADDVDGDKPIKVASVWDKVTPKSCRWRQAVSRDGGKTWDENWIMEWKRA